MRIYINGTEPNYNVTTYPSQNFEFQVNHVTKQIYIEVEKILQQVINFLYYSHYHLCDGYAYDAS